jgi:hypothetical protein
MEMFSGVLVLRGVAAAYMAATEAEPQVNPLIARFQAFFTTVRLRFYVLNLI